ncbi:unnamed protein product, partial [marine sediment metagenome]
MIESKLVDANGRVLHYAPSTVDPDRHGNVLVVDTVPGVHGTFKSVTRTTAGTTAIATPIPGGSLQLTGFIMSCNKGALQTCTLRFTDDTQVEDLIIQEMDVAITITSFF